MELLATFTAPDGNTTVDITNSSDIMGKATFTYAPDEAGTWTVMTWWEGAANVRGVKYQYAFSEQIPITALYTPPPLTASVSPMTQDVNPGETATLTATAQGGEANFTYQWYQTYRGAGMEMSGETSETLTVTLSDPEVYGYYCEITDSTGQVDASDTAQVKVISTAIAMEYIIIVAVIAVVIIAVVAYMYLKKRK